MTMCQQHRACIRIEWCALDDDLFTHENPTETPRADRDEIEKENHATTPKKGKAFTLRHTT